MKILVVQECQRTAEQLATVLTDQHYVVDIATDGQAGWALTEVFRYDLLLMDVLLPELDGISLCQRLRSCEYQVPILLLSAKNTIHDLVVGLDAGADDYLIKPFDMQELSARIRVLLRRRSYLLPPVLRWGDLCLDANTRTTTYYNQKLQLTPKEYRILELFMGCNSRVLTRSMILEHLWAFDEPPGEDTVKTHIKRLRQKLREMGAPGDFIETVYGLGYRLKQISESTTPSSSGQSLSLNRSPRQ